MLASTRAPRHPRALVRGGAATAQRAPALLLLPARASSVEPTGAAAAAAANAAVLETPPAGADALLARLAALGPCAADARTGQPIPDLSALLRPTSPGERVALVALSHFGDLTSFELAQRMARRALPALNASSPKLPPSLSAALASSTAAAAPSSSSPSPTTRRFVVLGLGSPSAARLFLRETGLEAAAAADGAPAVDFLATAAGGPLYRSALGFEPGFAPDAAGVSPYAKLLVMLAGLGSDKGATIREVLRGYVGDRSSDAIFFDRAWTPFDVLGRGYQRPFELATLRLFNMGRVLSQWGSLAPAAGGAQEGALLTQQGGVLVFKQQGEGGGVEVAFSHRDAGILCFADTDALTEAML